MYSISRYIVRYLTFSEIILVRFGVVLGSHNEKGLQKSDKELVVEKERWCPRSCEWPNASIYDILTLPTVFIRARLFAVTLIFLNRYTLTSIESQIRVLSDYAFMLRDYELALSNYRLLSTDYKLDKAWKRFAGVQVLASTYFLSTWCLDTYIIYNVSVWIKCTTIMALSTYPGYSFVQTRCAL